MDGGTPRYIASQNGHAEAVKLLSDAGATKDRAKEDGATHPYIASQKGHVEVVKLLCDVGANKDQAADDGTTPVSTLHRSLATLKL